MHTQQKLILLEPKWAPNDNLRNIPNPPPPLKRKIRGNCPTQLEALKTLWAVQLTLGTQYSVTPCMYLKSVLTVPTTVKMKRKNKKQNMERPQRKHTNSCSMLEKMNY